MTISALVGETLTEITGMEKGSERITFVTATRRQFIMRHDQDCCENVRIEDVTGNVADLLDAPIWKAEETSSDQEDGDALKPNEHAESWTWTFYTLATIKGYVTLRWLGESNGYYSERVEFDESPEGAL